MNAKHLHLLFITLLSAIVSCKKLNQSPVIGRWQEIKLRTYMVNQSGTILYDTTYLSPFTNDDYVQFNTNGTVAIGTDHYYYLNEPDYPKTPQLIPPVVSTMNYTTAGVEYILTSQSNLTNPGGFSSTDTVSLNNSILLVHMVGYSNIGTTKIISDAYYSK